MKVKYVKTGRVKNIHPKLAAALAKKGLVEPADEADIEQPQDVVTSVPVVVVEEPEATVEPEQEAEISPRTGLPKRTYTRRDMKAED